jgi:hypothetical protein
MIKTSRESMQAYISAKCNPFHSTHGHASHSIEDNKRLEDAEPASLVLEANDTFAHTSVLHTDVEVLHEPRKEPPAHPGPGAQRVEVLEYIKQQLDCYGKEPLLMDRYQLLGPEQRACGGVSSRA